MYAQTVPAEAGFTPAHGLSTILPSLRKFDKVVATVKVLKTDSFDTDKSDGCPIDLGIEV
jgi:hypothetical protein